MIQNIEARDAVISRIRSANPQKRFTADWTTAKYLANGERIVGIKGGFADSIIHKPHGNARSEDRDMLFFYGSTGVLVHEEPFGAQAATLFTVD